MNLPLHDLHIAATRPLISPTLLEEEFPRAPHSVSMDSGAGCQAWTVPARSAMERTREIVVVGNPGQKMVCEE
jgi:hypothetical protein